MSEVVVRTAEVKDAEGIANVHVKMWQQAYKGQIPDEYLDNLSVGQGTEGWKKQLENPIEGSFAYVADIDGKVVGWCTGGVSRDEDAYKEIGELYGIYVLPGYTDKGVGSKLMGQLLNTLKTEGYTQATLWVLDSNEKSKKWYEAKGWRIEGKTKVDKRDKFELREIRYITDL